MAHEFANARVHILIIDAVLAPSIKWRNKMITRILAASALSLAMFATVASAANRSVTHEEASERGRCLIGQYDMGTGLCIVSGAASVQINAPQATPDGRSHYEASQAGLKCFVGAYDISTGECIVAGKGQTVNVLAAPDSLGGANASGSSTHNFN